MYTYAWYHWITFFFIYCFLGWCFESTYVSLKKRHFVNRGFLRLPMLPIYGTGAVMMLWVSLPVQDNLVLVYLFGVAATTLLEYITGFVMEQLFKVRYWDYSHKKYNIHGYICLSSSIAWGFLTILMVEVLHRPIENFVLSMPFTIEMGMLAVVGLLFTADTIHSAKEAIDLGRALESMTKMKAELEAMQVQMALLKAEISQRVEELKDEHPLPDVVPATQARITEIRNQTLLKASELKNETEAALTARLEALAQRLETVTKKRDSIAKHKSFYRKRVLLGNPTAVSRKFAEAMKELRDSLNGKK